MLDIPVCADESCWSPSDAIEIICREIADYISIYVGKAAGLYYPQRIKSSAVFRGILSGCRRDPRCRASARLPHLPCLPPNLFPKKSEGPASEKKSALAGKRTAVGCRPPGTMAPPALILAADRRVALCPLRVPCRDDSGILHKALNQARPPIFPPGTSKYFR